jgi:hypothetical protein
LQHVPKTNEQTPSAEEVISDYQRLLERCCVIFPPYSAVHSYFWVSDNFFL